MVHGHRFMTRVELCVMLTKFVSTKAAFCQTHFSPSSNLVFTYLQEEVVRPQSGDVATLEKPALRTSAVVEVECY